MRISIAGTLLMVTGCGAAATASPSPARPSRPEPHVMVIMDENDGYSLTLGDCGSSSPDPYLCSLGSEYASVAGWYAVQHPSNPNYIDIVSGGDQGCHGDGCTGPYTAPSLGGQLTAAGIPWTAFMESMASPCFTGAESGEYDRSHNAFIDFTNIATAPSCAREIRPYPGASGIATALDASGAPDFVWITPNLADDMDDASIQQGDAWMRANLGAILGTTWFSDGGTVIVTMDENKVESTGSCCGDATGGEVPMLVLSSAARGRGTITVHGDHFGTLRTIEEVYHLPLLGAASSSANGDLRSLMP